jgi:protein disulfide-isomerase
MRFSPLAILAGLSAVALAEEEKNPVTDPTTFNGKAVPPFKELTPSNWEEETKKNKFWMVKHYRYVELGKSVVRMLMSYQSLL